MKRDSRVIRAGLFFQCCTVAVLRLPKVKDAVNSVRRTICLHFELQYL